MSDETRWIKSVDEFKAVSHPLRVRMLAWLREHGPANATELARQFATDTGSTSYHLRKLENFGFVHEVADPDGHPRARRWEAVHKTTSWSNTDPASDLMRRRQLEALMRDASRFEEMLPSLHAEWVDTAGMSGDQLVKLTAASLAELFEAVQAKIDELAARDATNPDARMVALYTAGYPR
ncbi:ArsR/SmtB family transcription factor [Allorhizocola rhizosphaerae]|uniref:ArsR/SmtB family transcription factor n=1 Tax=Allorhizocola rhizosphaerae TaxID=1872709 RepID=UPI000E3E750B|nr:helix-turn-helix domain-containing protein [Allorhizocola rhizosphaerae]